MSPVTTLITTGTPGSPVSLSSLIPDHASCAKLLFVAFAGNTDVVGIGLAGMNLTSGHSVINDAMQPGDTLSLESQDDDNRIDVGGYYFDSPTSGQKVLCTLWVG